MRGAPRGARGNFRGGGGGGARISSKEEFPPRNTMGKLMKRR